MIDHEDEQRVSVPRWVMQECQGDARDAMVLAQILYWLQPPMRGDQPHRTQRIVHRDGHGWMWMTDGDFADKLGMTRAQVQRARRALVTAGLVECKSAKVDGDKVTLVRPVIAGLRGIEQYEDTEPDPRANTRDSGSREDARSRARAVPLPNIGEETEPPPTPPAVELVPVSDEFEVWYDLYPEKVGKGAARAAWPKARRKATVEQLTDGLVRYLGSQRVADGIIANPATWLNQERWLDELPTARAKVSKSTQSLAAWAGRTDPTVNPERKAVGR